MAKSYGKTKLWMGAILWGGFLALVVVLTSYADDLWQALAKNSPEMKKMGKWLDERTGELGYLGHSLDLEIVFDQWAEVRAGDRLYLNNTNQEIGVVFASGVSKDFQNYIVRARIYKEHQTLIGNDSRFLLVHQPSDPAWVVKTILPKERRRELLDILNEYLQIHLGEIKRLLWPIFTEVAQESYVALQKDFPEILARHRQKLLDNLKKFREHHVDKEVEQIWEQTIWPLVQKKAGPILNPIAAEMWKKFPRVNIVLLWMYQSLPGTDNDHVKNRLEKYFEQEALPLVRAKQPELEKLLVEISWQASKDPKVREFFKKLLKEIFQDKEIISITKSLFLELFKKNKQVVSKKLKQRWESPEFRQKLDNFTQNFEPYLVDMINLLFLKRNSYIRPEFAQILRREVLAKDRFCIFVTASNQTQAPIRTTFVGEIP